MSSEGLVWNNASRQHTTLFNTVQDTLEQPCICTIPATLKDFSDKDIRTGRFGSDSSHLKPISA